MPFSNPDERPSRQIAPGVTLRTVAGDRLMLSFVYLDPHAVVPSHRHSHEQMGLLLEGALEFTIGDETRLLEQGDTWWIPSDVPHSVRNLDRPSVALDVFHPVREEYR